MNMAEWVSAARAHAGMTLVELGAAVGNVSKQAVNAWEKGRNMPTYETLLRIIEVTGFAEPPPGITFQPEQVKFQQGIREAEDDEFVPVGNAVGLFGIEEDGRIEKIADYIRVTRSFIRSEMPHITSPKNLALMPHADSSMEPTFRAGDLLVVDRGNRQIKNSHIQLFRLGGSVFVRRMFRHPISGVITAKSDNELFGSFDLDEESQIDILGTIVYVWSGKRLS